MKKATTSKFKLPTWEVSRLREMVPTVDELRIIDVMRDYRAIRKAYFGNTIPPVEEVLIRFLPRHEITRLSGYDDDQTDGLCSFGKHRGLEVPKTILISDDLRVNETAITLRHEMAHMKVNLKFGRYMGHGKHWKKEMQRLYSAGAFIDWL